MGNCQCIWVARVCVADHDVKVYYDFEFGTLAVHGNSQGAAEQKGSISFRKEHKHAIQTKPEAQHLQRTPNPRKPKDLTPTHETLPEGSMES